MGSSAKTTESAIVFTPNDATSAQTFSPPPQPKAPQPEPLPMLAQVPRDRVQAVELPPLPLPAPAIPEPPALPVAAPPPQITRPHTHGDVRVALLVPLSGPNAALGATLSNAAQLALFDTADEHLELEPIDTKGTVDGATAAIAQAIEQGADIVVGPVFSAEVKAVTGPAHDRQLPVLAFTTDKTALSPGVFTLGLLPESQVSRVFAEVKAEGRTRVAVLAPDTEYGHAMADAAWVGAQALGLQLVKTQFYPPATSDFRAIAQSVADYSHRKAALAQDKALLSGRAGAQGPSANTAQPFDALLIAEEGVKLKSLVALLTYYGIDPGPVRFLGTLRWDTALVWSEPMLQGAWYAAPPAAGLDVFEAHYAKTFGPLPKAALGLAGNAYDGIALVALLAKNGKDQPNAVRFGPQVLNDPLGYAGVAGLFRLTPDGGNERGLAVREVIEGGTREAVPAPERFVEP